MPNVQIRDASNPDKVLVQTLHLSFEPRENRPIYVRRRYKDTKNRGYLITGVLQYEIVEEAPEESGIVLLARPID
ncbi:hypothetical protein ACQP2Y_21425 [Actinoplanes sp. CA-051413]|uniref:hypothetical protein n=1 Tax=Actinoplanes sp. CA-051413 TaxID=3239899 RepID=UPI003D974D2A